MTETSAPDSASMLPVPIEILDPVCEIVSQKVGKLPLVREGVTVSREVIQATLEILNEEFTKSLPVESRVFSADRTVVGLDARLRVRGFQPQNTAVVVSGIFLETGICRKSEGADRESRKTFPMIRLVDDWTWSIAGPKVRARNSASGISVGTGSPVSHEPPVFDQCPVCSKGPVVRITGKQLFGLPKGDYLECSLCHAKFVPEKSDEWRLVSIGVIRDPTWRRYLNQSRTAEAWQIQAGMTSSRTSPVAQALKSRIGSSTYGSTKFPEGIKELSSGQISVDYRGVGRFFVPVPLVFEKQVTADLFFRIKTPLKDILKRDAFATLREEEAASFTRSLDTPAGKFLSTLKRSFNPLYRKFLNPFGEEEFRNFRMKSPDLSEKEGVYLVFRNAEPVYAGITKGSFRSAIDEGIGLILPTDCLLGGDEMRCRINAEICHDPDRFRIFACTAREKEAGDLHIYILERYRPGWQSS